MNLNFDLINGGAVLIAQPPTNAAAAVVNSAYANMEQVPKLTFFLAFAAGTADEEPVVSLTQATSAAGAGAKACNITSLKYISAADLKASQAWTEVTAIDRGNSVASYDTAAITSGTNQLALAITVSPSDLDLANGFTHVRANVADTGDGARQVCIIAVAQEKFYQGSAVPGLLS